MRTGGHGGGAGAGIGLFLFFLFLLIVFVAIIILVAWLISRSRKVPPRSESSAIDILKKRYAKGEIDEEEFEKRKKNLS